MQNNNNGRYGDFGGCYAPETLMQALMELQNEFEKAKNDPEFKKELAQALDEYAGRPSKLTHARRMSDDLGGAQIYLKREDLNHTGSHKINNALGQAILAKRMGKTKIIAETGAGQHGVASATVAALFNMECEVFMGREDMERQSLNVFRMRLLGASVTQVDTGTATLKDATSEAIRAWTARAQDTYYILGSATGPHPYPQMVHEFQSVISKEAKQQFFAKTGKLPDAVIACVGGGSNAIGAFSAFLDCKTVRLIGAEAAGAGIDTPYHAATITKGTVGVLHGTKSLYLQDEQGGIVPVYSISAGLDYPGIGPEHAYLAKTKRAEYFPITDDESVKAFEYLTKLEGILPAIESAHAIAQAIKIAPQMRKDQSIIICLSGRGDKDVYSIAKYKGEQIHES